MSTPQARAEEDIVILERILARRPEPEQKQVLTTTVRAALMRQYAVQVENTALRAELQRTENLFAEAHDRNEATMATYRATLEERAHEARVLCEARLGQLTAQLSHAKAALTAAEEQRDLLFATLMENIASLASLPVVVESLPDLCRAPITLREAGSLPARLLPASHRQHALFRDDAQASAAIRVLLASADLEHLWTELGPTAAAVLLRDELNGGLSPSERVLLLAGFDFWSRQGGVPLLDVIERLEGEPLQALLALTAATSAGPVAVDEWLSENTAELLAAHC